MRSSEPVHAGRLGQSRSGWKTAATAARSSVSCSNSARTRSSRTSLFSVEDVKSLLMGVADQPGDLVVNDRSDLF